MVNYLVVLPSKRAGWRQRKAELYEWRNGNMANSNPPIDCPRDDRRRPKCLHFTTASESLVHNE